MYPTKETILAGLAAKESQEQTAQERDMLAALKAWKARHRHPTLADLDRLLADLDRARESETTPRTIHGRLYCFIPAEHTIMLGQTPSIISTLHELMHAIHGSDETTACIESIHLFKQAYPKAYAKLTWKGHMLVKPIG